MTAQLREMAAQLEEMRRHSMPIAEFRTSFADYNARSTARQEVSTRYERPSRRESDAERAERIAAERRTLLDYLPGRRPTRW